MASIICVAFVASISNAFICAIIMSAALLADIASSAIFVYILAMVPNSRAVSLYPAFAKAVEASIICVFDIF